MKVKATKLADAVELELQSYSGEVREDMAGALKKIADACVKKLRETSPKRSGAYRKSWTRKITITPERAAASVYNKDCYSLTHLLEHGHAKAGGGRVPGIPHIAPVQEWAEAEVLEALAGILERT